MNTYVDFNEIEFVDHGGSYRTFLWIGWANDSMTIINFKKQMMTLYSSLPWIQEKGEGILSQ